MDHQEVGAAHRGTAHIRNYAGAGNGPGWLRVKWQSMYKIENEAQRTSKFFLKDEQTGREYIIDKEELSHWLRWV